jgi:superfamily II DNA or RNA helicase
LESEVMIRLELTNTSCKLVSKPDIFRAISDVLSFEPPGMEHRMRFMHPAVRKKWDGKTRLMKKNGTFPAGLLFLAETFLKENSLDYELVDDRVIPERSYEYGFSFPYELRPYQVDFLKDDPGYERGVNVVGTGGGKSTMMGRATDVRGVDTLVCTPDTGLREQIYKSFCGWVDPSWVSRDVRTDAPIIVCNVASLINKDKKFFERFKMLMTDEFHHSAAKSYLKLNQLASNCYWRYGFTGTNVRTDGLDMIMHGVLSTVLFEKSTSELIEEGYLVPADITIYRIQLKLFSRYNYKEAYDAIILNDDFAKLVTDIVRKKAQMEGKKTLVLVRRKEHGRLLESYLDDIATFVSGDDEVDYREAIKEDFNTGDLRCLIATSVFGEGQDIPNIEALVNVRLQKGEIETKQGTGRVLRLADGTNTYEESVKAGKSRADIVDFLLVGNKHLVSHSVERINQYKSERAFTIRVERL